MTGADAPALRALAAQMSQSAARLDGIRQGIRSRVYSIHWDGPDGAAFRRAWDGQHVPLLARVAEGLRDSAERLLAEADQQESASGAGGAGGGPWIGPATGDFVPAEDEDFPGNPAKELGIVFGGLGSFAVLMRDHMTNQVGAHTRANGTRVGAYSRWIAGQAPRMNPVLSANEMTSAARQLNRVAGGFTLLDAGFDFGDQWHDDRDNDISTGERLTRAGAAAAAPLALERGAMWAGAALGTVLIPIPGVGTVIGGAVGWAAAAAVNYIWDDEIGAAAAEVGSAVWDTGAAVVDFGGDVLEAGGELLGDIGEGAADLWEEWSPFS